MKRTLHPYLAWGSHVHVLLPCLHFTRGPILELGGGRYGTPLLSLYSQSRYCRTLETDKGWHEQITRLYPSRESHEIRHVPCYDEAFFGDRRWSLALVDQSSSESRLQAARQLRCRCDLVLIHDTERDVLANALDEYRYRFTFDRIMPYTSVGSDTDDLRWLIEYLQHY